MIDEPDDPPIEPVNYRIPQVVDLAGVRIARGMAKRPLHRVCRHRSLVYATDERRIYCEDCKTSLEPFDAFMVLIDYWQEMDREATRRFEKATEAKNAVIHRIAAREIEKTWRAKMAMGCPHCDRGILPEDVQGRMRMMSREIEIARRAKETTK